MSRAPSPPPGDPDYVGPAQEKPEPPPAPPAKRSDVDVLAFVAKLLEMTPDEVLNALRRVRRGRR